MIDILFKKIDLGEIIKIQNCTFRLIKVLKLKIQWIPMNNNENCINCFN